MLMQIFLFFWLIVAPTAAILWFARTSYPLETLIFPSEYFQGDATVRDHLASDALRVHHHLGRRRRDLFAELPVHPLDGRFAGAVPVARTEGRSPPLQNE